MTRVSHPRRHNAWLMDGDGASMATFAQCPAFCFNRVVILSYSGFRRPPTRGGGGVSQVTGPPTPCSEVARPLDVLELFFNGRLILQYGRTHEVVGVDLDGILFDELILGVHLGELGELATLPTSCTVVG